MEQFTTENGTVVEVFPRYLTVKDILQGKVNMTSNKDDREDPFYIVDLGKLVHLHKHWCDLLPSVKPFYAVKCNDDLMLLQTLAVMGTGFDCASRSEIRSILNLGVDPSRIIYANPCKQASHIKYAASSGVHLMTFDNEDELYKIKSYDPLAKLVLRFLADDPTAVCNLGAKFGAEVKMAPHLLSVAKCLGMNVVGVSFHVGSGAQSASAYANALSSAKEVFTAAEQLGFTMKLLDIGGGFPGSLHSDALFKEVTSTVNSSLASLFGQYKDLKVIAEPGRYFACSTHVLAVNVTSKRCKVNSCGKHFMYYINDGLYGSFNCIFYDHNIPTPQVLKCTSDVISDSSIWGPTCDGLDKINDNCLLPELNIGDWLCYEDMGAYTVSAHSAFNGFSKPTVYYYCTDREHFELENLLIGTQAREPISCQLMQNHLDSTNVAQEVDCC